MHTVAKILKYREHEKGTDLIINVPFSLKELITEKKIHDIECRFDDGRTISAEQRKKAYATITDIALWMGDDLECTKEIIKGLHIARTGCEYFSLSDCSMDMAREFINTLIEFAIKEGIQLSQLGIERTDDIGKYLWYCLKHKKCAVCGRQGEVHHWDRIGMGNDRKKIDDSKHRKICLCREHHTIAHQRGNERFEKQYKVYGITFED